MRRFHHEVLVGCRVAGSEGCCGLLAVVELGGLGEAWWFDELGGVSLGVARVVLAINCLRSIRVPLKVLS